MKMFTVEKGIVMPLNRSNVDTDAILPKQFLKSIKRSGFAVSLFEEWRYEDSWHNEIDYKKRSLNMDFVLNFPMYKNATVLLTRDNFGCGSSREHAVWALREYGFISIIAPSFGEIFYNNCFENSVLPIQLSSDKVDELFKITQNSAKQITIDLVKQVIFIDGIEFSFVIDEFRKNCMLKGLDRIGLTLQHSEQIKAFEEKYKKDCPWVFENTKI